MKLPKNEGSYELAPAGNHVAVCYALIDLGTQVDQFGTKHKIRIIWELPDEKMEDGKPFSVGKEYTFSMSQKSNLRTDFIAWRGRDFTPEEFETFQMENILGAPAMLNVTHRTSQAGNDYAVVSSIAPLIKGVEKPECENEHVCFSFEHPDDESFEKLPEWIRELICASPQYQQWKNNGQVQVPITEHTPPEIDDIPF